MSLTLDELKIVQRALEVIMLPMEDFLIRKSKINFSEAITLLRREIRLKETDFVRMVDAQGNPIDNDGN